MTVFCGTLLPNHNRELSMPADTQGMRARHAVVAQPPDARGKESSMDEKAPARRVFLIKVAGASGALAAGAASSVASAADASAAAASAAPAPEIAAGYQSF